MHYLWHLAEAEYSTWDYGDGYNGYGIGFGDGYGWGYVEGNDYINGRGYIYGDGGSYYKY